jgi:peptide/nickel transport system ATP-binding protein
MRFVEGRVELDGRELPIWDDRKMNAFRFTDVSIIPQYALSALNPTRRIGTLATELLAARNIPLDEVWQEFKRRLKLVGLPEDVLDRFPIELSGGMRQRVVMVLSSLLDPSLLIADEVTSALDVSTQRAVSELLVEFRDRGFVRSMIVITHDLSVLYQIADTILVMYAGKLAEKAPAETMIDAPAHPYTQLLLSSLPEVGIRYAEKRLSGIPGRPPSLLEPPSCCRFRTRCPFAYEQCGEEPPFATVAPDHAAACWKAARCSRSTCAARRTAWARSAAGSSTQFGT